MKPRERNSKVIYAPNSIYHGMPIHAGSPQDDAILLKIEVERFRDFFEFLFEHSNHCDHITQRDAWREFEIYEAKNSFHAEQIRKKRIK